MFNNGVIKMAKCPLCGKEVPSDDLKFQFYDNEGAEHYVCSKCDEAINSIVENTENYNSASDYINDSLNQCTDEALHTWLDYLINSSEKCPMCGMKCSPNDLEFQFYGKDSSKHYVCNTCHESINSIIHNDNNFDKSLEYINNCINSCTDEELRQWINDTVALYTENSEEYDEESDEEYNEESDEEYTSASSDTTFWISSLRGVYKFVFFVIIIIGIVLCAMLCSNEMIGIGVIVLAVSILIAVMLVGFAIVFLDLARDIHRIRNILEEQSNDKE